MPDKKIDLKNHVIICGFGIVGKKIADMLVEHNIDYIIVEKDVETAKHGEELGYRMVNADATSSRALRGVGISSAKAIAVVMGNDAENLFAVLTARDLNKGIFIATRSNDDFVREKLVDAGADYIVMPQKTASKEIVKELVK